MNRASPLPNRRHLLKGAALAAAASVVLPEPRAGAQTQAADYPSALWAPADTANYTASDRPSQRHPVDLVVIHVTQTTFDKALTIFQNPKKHVSAHYVVRSSDGRVAQCVRETDIAWHAGNWEYNTRSVGIEHEGWVDRPPTSRTRCTSGRRGSRRRSATGTASPGTGRTSSATTKCRAPTTRTRAGTGTGRGT